MDWLTPTVALGLLAGMTQLVLSVAALWTAMRTRGEVETTRGEVAGVRKETDGRFSQLIDLIGRLSGAPERRAGDRPQ